MNPGFDFLKNRGIDKNTVTAFHLAYFENNKIYTADSASSAMYCKFQNMLDPFKIRFDRGILIPVFDLYSDIVSFQVRKLEGVQKFDSIPFKKSKVLFGLNKSCYQILTKKFVYVTEGAFDAMMLWQYGEKNVVSSLGCNLGFDQICLLSRFTDFFKIVYDNDEAGRVGMREAGKRLMSMNYKYMTIYLPVDEDIDDFLIKHGIEEFRNHAEHVKTVL